MVTVLAESPYPALADALSGLTGCQVTVIPGGFRVKDTGTHHVDILLMIYNWRVARTSKACDESCDRHWCYSGTSWITLVRAAFAAAEWDGGDDTDPAGWNKNGQTGEWRAPQPRPGHPDLPGDAG